jgi:hypothetical protein
VQVLELLLDRKAADARHAREVAARDAEITHLQDYIDQELSELQQRQCQVRATDARLHLRQHNSSKPCGNLSVVVKLAADWCLQLRECGQLSLCDAGGGYSTQLQAAASGGARSTAGQPGGVSRGLHTAQKGTAGKRMSRRIPG